MAQLRECSAHAPHPVRCSGTLQTGAHSPLRRRQRSHVQAVDERHSHAGRVSTGHYSQTGQASVRRENDFCLFLSCFTPLRYFLYFAVTMNTSNLLTKGTSDHSSDSSQNARKKLWICSCGRPTSTRRGFLR